VLKTRVIPTLTLRGSRLVKTRQFGATRDVGDPVKAPMVYDAQLADELIFLDMDASRDGRSTEHIETVINRIAGVCFMPLTAGGGIRTADDVRRVLGAGADKVAINTAAVERPALIADAAARFGSQCVVVAIDVRREPDGTYRVWTHGGTRASGREAAEWAREATARGAGEILVTSIDRDGTMSGYDLELVRHVATSVNVPVIASGGAGKCPDLVDALTKGQAAAVAAASLFHFTDQSPIKAKAYLRRAGIPVR
jgi:imidazole glycerol-phosphate synthase subunit HisF